MFKSRLNQVELLYKALMDSYGPQGWWPLIQRNSSFHKPEQTNSNSLICSPPILYHPGDYSLPKTDEEVYEIMLGAILTQNTSWRQAEKALLMLYAKTGLVPEKILGMTNESLSELIKPAGYFNQKAEYIKNITKFFIALDNIPSREQLLTIKGVGEETADTILLYAYKMPEFVVDAYTRRILEHLKLLKKPTYSKTKSFFENNIKKDFKVYQEFHALLVQHAKLFYTKKPYALTDPLMKIFT